MWKGPVVPGATVMTLEMTREPEEEQEQELSENRAGARGQAHSHGSFPQGLMETTGTC